MAVLLLKLSLVTLLAIFITHARSEPLPNSGGFDEELKQKGMTIPNLVCIKTCHNCACTYMYPPEANFCACMDTKSKSKPTNDDEIVYKSAAGEFDEKLPRKGRIPYLECIRTCHRCACTKMLPVEANFCSCMDAVVDDTQTNIKPTDNELLHKSAVGKSSWPELVGVKGETAAAKIERENPQVDAIVVKEGTPTIDDRRHNRVWVWVDEHGVVTTVPQRG